MGIPSEASTHSGHTQYSFHTTCTLNSILDACGSLPLKLDPAPPPVSLSFVISGQRTGLSPWQSHYFTARFLPSTSGQGSYIPSWGLADMGTMYKRDTAPKKSPSLWCEDEGSMCVVRGGGVGIQGTLVTRPCCPGTSCVFGRSAFYCVRDTEEEDYRDMGETQEDRTEHGPW